MPRGQTVLLDAAGTALQRLRVARLLGREKGPMTHPISEMTAVGFEPTPLRTGALSQRLRPLGQTVLRDAGANEVPPLPTTKFLRRQKQSMALTKF